jgi:transcriptional regulator with XRE-family HTH domain
VKIDAEKLKHARTSRGLSLEQLAKGSGITLRTLRAYEEGNPGSASTIRRLAAALFVQPDDLRSDGPSASELARIAAGESFRSLDKGFMEIIGARVLTGEELAQAMFPCDALTPPSLHAPMPDESALRSSLIDSVQGLHTCWCEQDASGQRECAAATTRLIQRLGGMGLWVFAARYPMLKRQMDPSGPPMQTAGLPNICQADSAGVTQGRGNSRAFVINFMPRV